MVTPKSPIESSEATRGEAALAEKGGVAPRTDSTPETEGRLEAVKGATSRCVWFRQKSCHS